MTLAELKVLRDSEEFHHATYRSEGTVWEGLWIYVKDVSAHRGFRQADFFPKDHAELDAAFELLEDTFISRGSYGNW